MKPPFAFMNLLAQLLNKNTASLWGFDQDPNQASFPNAPLKAIAANTSATTTFHPAKERPRKRPAASLHAGGLVVASSASRFSELEEPPTAALHSVGPCHHPHSTPE